MTSVRRNMAASEAPTAAAAAGLRATMARDAAVPMAAVLSLTTR